MISFRDTVNKFIFRSGFILLLVLSMTSCGGGTSGTGIVIQGKVLRTDHSALVGGSVTIEETGDVGQIDGQGRYLVKSPSRKSNVKLRVVNKENLNALVTIDGIPSDTNTVEVDLIVDTDKNTAEARRIDFSSIREISLSASIRGRCGSFFDSTNGLTQTRFLSNGTLCNLHVYVTGDGRPQAGALVSLERMDCSNSSWRRVTSERTPSGARQGKLEMAFTFENSTRSCAYRLVAGQTLGPQDVVNIQLLKKK